jgi:hypothetical protein
MPGTADRFLNRLDYEPVMGHMLVTFRTGRTSVYFDVPLEIYLALRFSNAREHYFRSRVAGRFRYRSA